MLSFLHPLLCSNFTVLEIHSPQLLQSLMCCLSSVGGCSLCPNQKPVKYAQRHIQESLMLPSPCMGSRGSRRNSALRAPSRGMKSGAEQRRGFAPQSRSLAGSWGAGREPSARAGPSCSPPACRRCPARWCERCRLATASLPGCGACPVRGRAGPASRATRVRSSGCSRRPGRGAGRAGRAGSAGDHWGLFLGPSGTRTGLHAVE